MATRRPQLDGRKLLLCDEQTVMDSRGRRDEAAIDVTVLLDEAGRRADTAHDARRSDACWTTARGMAKAR